MRQMSTFQNTSNIIESIKNVALYTRKSRGDADEDLEKHRHIMENICKENNWNFVEYSEIGSGDSIEDRVAIKDLLRDVEAEIYDAVLVFDYDRLGRGSGTDQDTIIFTLKRADTLIIVANPFQILDPNDERDEETMDFKGFMARREYKMITKRLSSGKKIGLRMGRWTNGVAPFGYIYNRELKGLTVNKEEADIYKKLIVKEYINGKSAQDIAWGLNKKKIPSPRNGLWSDTTVLNLLRSEVHLGHIVSNKTEGQRGKTSKGKKPFRNLPKSEWITVKNCHQAIKTEEEHLRILAIMKNKNRGSSVGINALSGLVKCFKCEETLIIQREEEKVFIKNCAKCKGTRGGDSALVEHSIRETIVRLREALSKVDDSQFDRGRDELILKEIAKLEKELNQNELAIGRIEEAFEMGMYDAQKAKERMKQRQENILELEEKIRTSKKSLSNISRMNNNERLLRVDTFLEQIGKTENSKEMNEIYKSIIDSISWKRTEWDEVVVTVNFL